MEIWSISLCDVVEHPQAAAQIFLAADGEDLSTPDLLQRIARLMGHPERLISVPVNILRTVGRILGKEDVLERLTGSLRVDVTKARSLLNWQPPFTLAVELERTVRWYMDGYKNRGVHAC